ncbi:hypothetical protein CsSME_00003848 [Camellia sinensis var. sinensis]
MGYLAMKTDLATAELINSDIDELKIAAKRLLNHATNLVGLGFGTSLLKWVASFAAINWNVILVAYSSNEWLIVVSCVILPENLYSYIASFAIPFKVLYPNDIQSWLFDLGLLPKQSIGDFGKWVAFIAVVLRLFFPRHFPDWLEMPGSLILLLVGVAICLIIGCYLLQEHIRASGGFRNSFTQSHGVSNTLGIILLLVYPVWALVLHFI